MFTAMERVSSSLLSFAFFVLFVAYFCSVLDFYRFIMIFTLLTTSLFWIRYGVQIQIYTMNKIVVLGVQAANHIYVVISPDHKILFHTFDLCQ